MRSEKTFIIQRGPPEPTRTKPSEARPEPQTTNKKVGEQKTRRRTTCHRGSLRVMLCAFDL